MRRPVEYCDAIFSTAYTARLCPDVLLRAFGKAYPAHRVILASQNAYFSTLLRWVSWQPAIAAGPTDGAAVATGEGLEESSGLPSHDVVLGEDVTQRGFEWILEYFYASPHVGISSDNAFDVLAAAHYLGVNAVQTACVDFLAQHLDPHNLAACLLWATRADHGEASDMIASSCRRLLALRLPRHLAAWAPALTHIEPRTLLDIMACDHLAVPTEYDRYCLVKAVAQTIQAEAAAAAAAEEEEDEELRGGACRTAAATAASSTESLEVRRMLSSALRLTDEGLAGQLHLARSSPAGGLPACQLGSRAPATAARASSGPAAVPTAACAAAAALVGNGAQRASLPLPIAGAGAGAGSPEGAIDMRASSSDFSAASCVGACDSGSSSSSALTSSQASSRSTVRLCELGDGGSAAAAVTEDERGADEADGRPSSDCSGEAAASAAAAAAAAAAACAQLLLREAVRYEHLTVPQLMAVEAEGLVAPSVLHAALWERTRLDCKVHSRGATNAAIIAATATARQDVSDGNGGAAAAAAAGSSSEMLPPPRPAFRAFRVCWCLSAGALKKLQPRGMLQSELHQHAGALWQLRLCCSDRSRDHLGLFVGRHLAAAAVAQPPGCAAAAAGPARVASPARLAEPAGGGPAQPQQRRPWRAPRRQQQAQQQQHVEQQQQPFLAYTDTGAALRARCRVSVLQSDNTALGGRLSLGDTGHFDADFAAGGYFGAGQLVSRADLAGLEDEAEVLVFMALQVLAA